MPPGARLPLLFLGVLSLIAGVLAGLARLAVSVPDIAAAQAGSHGALMIAAFLGTVISLERAVALAGGQRGWAALWPYCAPLCAGLGGVALLAGLPAAVAPLLAVAGSAILTFGSLLLLRRQPALYLATLALGAACWLIGCLCWFVGASVLPAVHWWMAFLVLTIAGERLELTRYLPTTAAAQKAFAASGAAQLLGLVLAFWHERYGLTLFAISLVALAAWLLRNDIARRTVRQSGLTRFIACCLLGGYAWLAFGGALGAAGAFVAGHPWRDAALHAIFLGFIFSMIFGHAPIIFPAVARIKIPYHPAFYLPLILLHASLLARVAGVLAWPETPALRQHAAIANGLALALFILTLLTTTLRSHHHSRNAHANP